MRLYKITSKVSGDAIPVVPLRDCNEMLRQIAGFISGILVRSRKDAQVFYYMSMWMDSESAHQADETIQANFRAMAGFFEIESADDLDVILSITAEGDFRPIVN